MKNIKRTNKKRLRSSSITLIGGKEKPGAKLSSMRIKMSDFCNNFNKDELIREKYLDIPVSTRIHVYSDLSYEYSIRGIPVSELLKKKITLDKNGKKVISKDDLLKIALEKMEFFKTTDEQKALDIVKGTLKSFGEVYII